MPVGLPSRISLRYPKSFLHLLLVGFGLVALPLIFGILNNAVSIDRLAEQSQKAVYQAVQATQASRAQAELITAMERSARQYAVLGDEALLDGYRRSHADFVEISATFATFPLEAAQRAQQRELARGEQALFQRVTGGEADAEALAGAFAELSRRAQEVAGHSSVLIDREVDNLRQMTAKARRIVVMQLMALVPVAVFLVAGFTVLISRPIGQIDQGIRRLGDGRYDEAIRVAGPEDLENLGRQLDWLRGRLQALEEQKTRFLRHVSHELKTPLTALREGSELLAEEVGGRLTPEQHEIVGIVRENSVRLQKQIEDLLNYSAVRAEPAPLERRLVRMEQVVRRVAEDQKMALLAKRIELELACDDLIVDGDEEALRVLVDNLLSNAIKFSPSGGHIHVSLAAGDGEAVLDVVDQGPGIAAEDRDRVFDAFYQGRIAPQGAVKGSGLGLSIAREHVLAHGGRIEVLGEGGGHLQVGLPLKRPEPTP